MGKTYGYARISTEGQNIERQIYNISNAYPNATIFQETSTGTKTKDRKKFNELLEIIKPGDTIVFDEASRMSRNAADGVTLYKKLYSEGVNLVFLKEPYINTSADVDEHEVEMTFREAQNEVDLLHKRTSEGIARARANGKQIGGVKGRKLNVKKKEPSKAQIRKYSRDFEGTLTDLDVIKLTGLAKGTYYKYKAELKQSTMGVKEADQWQL